MKKKFLLIDGNAFCYRAFYAVRKLTTSQGQPTNAVFGFVAMLNKLLSEHRPDYLAVAFDLKAPTFRHHRFAEYKIQRKPMPDELSVQIPVIKKVLAAYRIPIFEKKGYEADDIIATLASKLNSRNLEILIVTGDKDILQIVSDNIKVINPHKDNLILDESWVRQRFGVAPEKIVEIMSLAGDASDNISGVPGIGEASAINLIKKFGSLEEVLVNADKIANKTRRQNLKDFSAQARMSRELAKLDCNVPQLLAVGSRGSIRGQEQNLTNSLEQLKVVEPDKETLFEIFKELEFRSLMSKVIPGGDDKVECRIIAQDNEVQEFLQKASSQKSLAVYFWASHRDPMWAKVQAAAFALEERLFFFHPQKLSVDALRPVLENANIKKIGHNLKYLKVLLANSGIALRGISFDTMVAAYLINPARTKYALSDLALENLNLKLEDMDQAGTDKQQAQICCQNVNAILKLNKILETMLKQKNLLDLFENIERPLIEVLAEMEKEGMTLDKDFLLHLSVDFEKRLKVLTKAIYEMAGESFNINSPKQLSAILFEKLKLPQVKRTKTGSSTDTEVLQKLARLHPVASSLLEFREVSKLKSTYVDGLIKLLHPQTGKIHTSFNQTGTATGRLSSSRPNLQNIPIKTELGKRIRQAFIAGGKGDLLLSADYSQIELRILAHLSGDRNLISAFKKDLDIHAYTASLIFGESPDKVTTRMRNTAKTVNFGIAYGMTPFGLSKDLGIGQSQAEEFIEAYFRRYPGVKRFIARQIEKAEKHGFVTTLLLRRRYIPQIKSEDENLRQFAQRVAINTPVQGSASDLIKAAMVEIDRTLKAQRLSTRMLLQVHDELVFALPQQELEKARTLIKGKMENVIRLKVPIKVILRTGKNWLDLK